MKQFKVLKDFGDFKAGDVVNESQLDEATLVADLIDDGTFEEVVDDTTPSVDSSSSTNDVTPSNEANGDVTPTEDTTVPPVDTASSSDTSIPPTNEAGEEVEKILIFNGKTVISKTVRVVEDKEVHHVRLEDGTEMDLTDEEHQAMLDSSQTA